MWHVGIDVGGTFTDLFAFDNRSGESRTSKVLTTQHDRAEGVFNALKAADIPAAAIDTLVHGSTTATKARRQTLNRMVRLPASKERAEWQAEMAE